MVVSASPTDDFHQCAARGSFSSLLPIRALSTITKLDEFLAKSTDRNFEALGKKQDVPKFLRAEGQVISPASLLGSRIPGSHSKNELI